MRFCQNIQLSFFFRIDSIVKTFRCFSIIFSSITTFWQIDIEFDIFSLRRPRTYHMVDANLFSFTCANCINKLLNFISEYSDTEFDSSFSHPSFILICNVPPQHSWFCVIKYLLTIIFQTSSREMFSGEFTIYNWNDPHIWARRKRILYWIWLHCWRHHHMYHIWKSRVLQFWFSVNFEISEWINFFFNSIQI